MAIIGSGNNKGSTRAGADPKHRFIFSLFMVACWLSWSADLNAGVLAVDIEQRGTVLDGKRFGRNGPYEWIIGTVTFGFDPSNSYNRRITDLSLAPRGANGLVEARANFVVLRPSEAGKGKDLALVEVSNRGGKFSHRYFNRASMRRFDPTQADAYGDGLMMQLGLTVIWVGWQFDVPDEEGLLRLKVPVARNPDGTPLTGLVRSDWVVDEPVSVLALAHRNHRPYLAVSETHPDHVLTVRDGRDSPRQKVARDQWSFARLEGDRVVPDATSIYLKSGFRAGKIYELVYRAKDPAVVGLGLAAIRDIISYAKYDKSCPFPVRQGMAAGVSQTGRFLRTLLYGGFNIDERGRKAFDGLMIITAGAGRGSFNHRFAQPSRDGHAYSAFFYPTDIFPFTSNVLSDAQILRGDGLLARLPPVTRPKIFSINTGYEYWGRAGALIHVSPDGLKDATLPANERIYHLASGQHFVDVFPPNENRKMANGFAYWGNPLDYSVNYRALLVRMVDWVHTNMEPPNSAYPRIADGTLVPMNKLALPNIAGISLPLTPHVAYRTDYGPRWSEGIVDFQPPHLGPPYSALVPQLDPYGNERGGVLNLETRVPLATYTPWHVRSGFAGGNGSLLDFRGNFIPFPRTKTEKTFRGDSRPALEDLYPSREIFLDKVRAAALLLVAERFLLHVDRPYVVEKAGRIWDWIHAAK